MGQNANQDMLKMNPKRQWVITEKRHNKKNVLFFTETNIFLSTTSIELIKCPFFVANNGG